MSAESTSTVLDHVDGISVQGSPFTSPTNEYWALVCFRSGLDFLHQQVSSYDAIARKNLGADGHRKYFLWGGDPRLAEVPFAFLTSLFHWYAVTACQYVRVIGAIAYQADRGRPEPKDYVKRVIPEVLAFRDKVAAHLAGMTQHGQDSEAERAASLMPPVAFCNGSFHVGMIALAMRKAGKRSDSSALAPWSIAGIHRRLCDRYWPENVDTVPKSVGGFGLR